MLLTSLNLSHFPVSHLSSRKLPLSERAETCPKATAHTHSKATLSICGHTTAHTDWERTLGPAVGHRNRAETEAVQSASHLRRTLSVSSVNINTELSGGFFLPCRISCSPDCMCSLPFLSLVTAASPPSPSLRTGCLCAAENGNALGCVHELCVFFCFFVSARSRRSWLLDVVLLSAKAISSDYRLRKL